MSSSHFSYNLFRAIGSAALCVFMLGAVGVVAQQYRSNTGNSGTQYSSMGDQVVSNTVRLQDLEAKVDAINAEQLNERTARLESYTESSTRLLYIIITTLVGILVKDSLRGAKLWRKESQNEDE